MARVKSCLLIAISGLMILPVAACSSGPASTANTPVSEEPVPSSAPATVDSDEPVLSTALKRGCFRTTRGNFDNAGLAIGERAVNFTLKDIYGNEYRLSRLLALKPVVMVFGSFT